MDDFLSRCPTAGEIAWVNARFRITFKADVTNAAGLVCRSAAGSANFTREQERAYAAVLAVARLSFSRRLPWTTKSLFDWFSAAVKTIDYDGTQKQSNAAAFSQKITIALDSRAYIWKTTRWSVDDAGGGGLSVLLEEIVHETRHAEGNHPHTCGPYADRTLAELGAYGVQYYFWVWIARYADSTFLSSPPDHYKANALRIAAEVGKNFICDHPSP